MIIIIEGADGTGKSTLAEGLKRTLDNACSKYQIIHRTHRTDADKENLLMDYRDILLHKSNVILDRAWYSEMAYGPEFRGKSCISREQMLSLEELLFTLGGFVIYCRPRDLFVSDKTYERAKDRGEDFVETQQQHQHVCWEYERIFRQMPHKVVVLEYVI